MRPKMAIDEIVNPIHPSLEDILLHHIAYVTRAILEVPDLTRRNACLKNLFLVLRGTFLPGGITEGSVRSLIAMFDRTIISLQAGKPEDEAPK